MTFPNDGRSIPKAPPKDPDDVMSWGTDWVDSLASGEVITNSEWIVFPPTGLTIMEHSFDDTSAAVLLADGILGVTYTLTNRVTTRSRIEDRSMYIACMTK